jgi:hypothetical protein
MGVQEKCRDFTDGSQVCASEKAWQVFFATMNKNGWDETKPKLSDEEDDLALEPKDVQAITPKVFARRRKKIIR